MPTSSTVWWAPVSRSPFALNPQAEPAVAGEQVEHVVEEADPGLGAGGEVGTRVQAQLEADLGLPGLALAFAGALAHRLIIADSP